MMMMQRAQQQATRLQPAAPHSGPTATAARVLRRRPAPPGSRQARALPVQASLSSSSSSSSGAAAPLNDGAGALRASQPPPAQPLPPLPGAPAPEQPHHNQQQQQEWRVHSLSPEAAAGGGSGSNNGGNSSGGGGGGGDGGDNEEEDERILDLKEAEAAAAAAKVRLPADMLETAKTVGLRSTALSKYISLQAVMFTGGLVQRFPWVRDRMIFDELYLFKVLAECLIDCACATVAEVRKRGDDFWKEFEFYLSDMIVGITLDVVLVTLICPRAIIGGSAAAKAGQSALQKWLANIPAAALEAGTKGVREYSLGQRLACLGVKFLEYSLAGIVCGFIGQGVANGLITVKRQLHQGAGEHHEEEVPMPPVLKTALVWGLFMGVSSNLRYQAVFGIERVVDATIAKRIPAIAYAATVFVRFVNNVIGGEQFIDLARWAGVQ